MTQFILFCTLTLSIIFSQVMLENVNSSGGSPCLILIIVHILMVISHICHALVSHFANCASLYPVLCLFTGHYGHFVNFTCICGSFVACFGNLVSRFSHFASVVAFFNTFASLCSCSKRNFDNFPCICSHFVSFGSLLFHSVFDFCLI